MLTNSLIYSVIDKNDAVTLFKVKDYFVPQADRVVLEFVKDFYANYKKLPELDTVENKFSIQLIDNPENPDYWYKEILSKFKEGVVETAIIGSAKNKKKAIELFQQAIVDYNVDLDTSIAVYSDGKRRIKSYDDRKGTGGISHLATGNADLDSFSLGYKRADLWTVGGHEGIGKTWWLLHMADWADQMLISNNIDKNILIVSGEMDCEELEERLDAIRCELSYNRLSRGGLTTAEERKYKRFLAGFESNIKIVDSFDNLKDIDYYMTVYRPAITFIDGSHLLSSSYEWTEIAKVTAGMKKLTRNRKIPIINTTHLKADRGKSASGGDIDDFAYTKGYTRDSDIVGVMYASDMMQIENKVGIDWVKARRGDRTQMIWQNDYETCACTLFESKTGAQLAKAGGAGGGGGSTRNGQNSNFPY